MSEFARFVAAVLPKRDKCLEDKIYENEQLQSIIDNVIYLVQITGPQCTPVYATGKFDQGKHVGDGNYIFYAACIYKHANFYEVTLDSTNNGIVCPLSDLPNVEVHLGGHLERKLGDLPIPELIDDHFAEAPDEHLIEVYFDFETRLFCLEIIIGKFESMRSSLDLERELEGLEGCSIQGISEIYGADSMYVKFPRVFFSVDANKGLIDKLSRINTFKKEQEKIRNCDNGEFNQQDHHCCKVETTKRNKTVSDLALSVGSMLRDKSLEDLLYENKLLQLLIDKMLYLVQITGPQQNPVYASSRFDHGVYNGNPNLFEISLGSSNHTVCPLSELQHVQVHLGGRLEKVLGHDIHEMFFNEPYNMESNHQSFLICYNGTTRFLWLRIEIGPFDSVNHYNSVITEMVGNHVQHLSALRPTAELSVKFTHLHFTVNTNQGLINTLRYTSEEKEAMQNLRAEFNQRVMINDARR